MAHRIAGEQQSLRPHTGPQGDLCNLRHPRHAHHRWRSRIHRPCNKRSADQLGGPPPDFLGIPPSREQPRRNRGQNRQAAHCREHRPRGHPEVSVFQGPPDLQELPLPRHTDVTGHVPLRPTNQRSATYPPNTTSTANPGRYDPAHEADSTKEAPIPGQETLDRTHQGPLPPQTRRQSTGAKPDRPPPNQMGQHRRGGRGHAVPSVSGQDGQQR